MRCFINSLLMMLTSLLIGCDGYFSIDPQNIVPQYYSEPLTKREELYKKKLLDNGVDSVEYIFPRIGMGPKGTSRYTLKMWINLVIDSSNRDSIIFVRDQIVKDLYTEVVEDSIIMDVSTFDIDINYLEMYKNNAPFVSKKYYKDSLARKYNLKVIQHGKDIYERVPYWKKVK